MSLCTLREHNFGTVGYDLKPEPGYVAAKTLSSVLAGYTVEKRLDSASEKDFIFLLTKENRRALALWTTDTDHVVTIPLDASEGTVVDMLGHSKRISWQPNQLTLAASSGPRYLLIAD